MLKICYGCMRPKESSPICEGCGYDERSENSDHQLPVGTKVGGQYVLGKVLGQGGFGITYIGWDTALHIPVAVKEYFPSGYAGRSTRNPLQVTSYDNQNSHDFQRNKQRFLREAESLSRLWDIPQIVRVLRHFEENGTAYIAMEYVEGMDLRKYLKQLGRPMTIDEVMQTLGPIMEGLSHVHAADLVHRDISPDNIMVLPNGGTKLLDFGAARYVENADAEHERNTSTQAILKHGFAPPEQYRSHGALGPWTDIYAMCATVYYCLTGKIPTEAMSRMMESNRNLWDNVPGLTARQRAALEKGMSLQPEQRYSSIRQLWEALQAKKDPVPISTAAPTAVPTDKVTKAAKPRKKKNKQGVLAAILAVVICISAAIGYYLYDSLFLNIADSLDLIGVESGHTKVISISSNHTYTDITWSSSNPDVATVTEQGLVTAVSNGETEITANYKNQTDVCRVVVEIKNPFTFSKQGGSLTITGYKGTLPQKLIIPQKIDGIPVTSIGNYAFIKNTDLISVTIPNSVTSIGSNAFSDCIKLTDVYLSFGVKSIGDHAFNNCSSLANVTIPVSVISIGNYAFNNCTSLTTVSVPGSTASIGNYAFCGCSGLIGINIRAVKHIGDHAFANCSSLKNVVISKGCTIGENAFPKQCKVLSK